MVKKPGPRLFTGWDVVGHAFDTVGTKPRALKLWMCMLCHADCKTGELWPDNETLMRLTKLPKTHFSSAMSILESLGMIEVLRKDKPGSYHRRIPMKFLKWTDTAEQQENDEWRKIVDKDSNIKGW